MEPTNIVCIMADQHTRRVLGAYGAEAAVTPNLDALAAAGTTFTRAYSSSPICVPARASFATGRYVHDIGCWDNHLPYDGSQAASWGHRLTQQDFRVATIGKLHYASEEADTGFPQQHLPIHVLKGKGGVGGLLRDRMRPVSKNRRHIEGAGAGETEYTRFDRQVADRAARWIREEGGKPSAPWALFVSFVSPHFPLVSPPEFRAKIDDSAIPEPVAGRVAEWSRHPADELNRRLQGHDEPFTEAQVRQAVASYYGLVAYVDHLVGTVLEALRDCGLSDCTRILYTSDHGEMLGDHGLWWKHTMYEGSVGVPLIAAGPGIPSGTENSANVSTIDFFPTFVECVGATLDPADHDLPGTSLLRMAASPELRRPVFSEYHAVFSAAAIYMLIPGSGRYKYVHYVAYPPQLFDLEADPSERNDLSGDPAHASVLRACRQELERIVNPQRADQLARASQARRLEELGGAAEAERLAGDFTHTPVRQQHSDESSLEGGPA